MPTEHKDIQDPQLHEPVGAGLLTGGPTDAGKVYQSDGAGSGAWKFTPYGVDVATAGQSFVADGAGNGAFKDSTNIHGEMFVTGYTTPFAIIAAVDPTLATDTDYIKITAASMWQAGHLDGITFTTDKLTVPKTGSYEVSFWASLEVSATTTLVGIKYAINDIPPYSTRKILTKSKAAVDINNVFGRALVGTLNAGDTISLYIAADGATNIIGREAGLMITLLEEA